MVIKECRFHGAASWCDALMVNCDGYNDICKFYKTPEQFEKCRDDAIKINRKMGNCNNCKYKKIRCKLQRKDEEYETE